MPVEVTREAPRPVAHSAGARRLGPSPIRRARPGTLQRTDGRYLLETMCIDGGQGLAAVF